MWVWFVTLAIIVFLFEVVMKKVATEIVINASIGSVWKALTDTEDFPNWNPFVSKMTGVSELGGRMKMYVKGSPLPIPVTVTNFKENELLSWKGGLAGVAQGEHAFKLTKLKGEQVLLEHYEEFTGFGTVAMLSPILNFLTAEYNAFNRALKKKLES